jgi:hypothetical protein
LEDGVTVSIFIKSWREDLKWLRYSLRFLEKNWMEPEGEVVVMLDTDCRGGINTQDYELNLKLSYEDPWPDGYSHAMYCKACADLCCVGESIILMDSDTMLLERCDSRVFFGDLPIIPWVSYDEHNRVFPHSPWQRVTERVMKIKSPRHYMPTMPILYWADTMQAMRSHIMGLHGTSSFKDAVYSDRVFKPWTFGEHPITFVDYDCLGLYAERFEGHRYIFRHVSQVPPSPFKQFHSWTEWNEATPGILDRCLGEAVTA